LVADPVELLNDLQKMEIAVLFFSNAPDEQ
jgi:hypothetical protein